MGTLGNRGPVRLLPCCRRSRYRSEYHKVPKFSDAIQTKGPNLKVFCQKDANGINSEDPDQTASGLYCLSRSICLKT